MYFNKFSQLTWTRNNDFQWSHLISNVRQMNTNISIWRNFKVTQVPNSVWYSSNIFVYSKQWTKINLCKPLPLSIFNLIALCNVQLTLCFFRLCCKWRILGAWLNADRDFGGKILIKQCFGIISNKSAKYAPCYRIRFIRKRCERNTTTLCAILMQPVKALE